MKARLDTNAPLSPIRERLAIKISTMSQQKKFVTRSDEGDEGTVVQQDEGAPPF